MNKTAASILMTICALPALPADAADMAHAKGLHDGVCTICHGTDYYTREARIIRSPEQLRKQVRGCQEGAGENWTEEQIEDVAAWLNAEFYKFK